MNMTDPVADMITRISNGVRTKLPRVDIPFSKFKVEIARILKDEGYIATYKVMDEKVARSIIDYGAAIPAHSNASWIASDKIIAERPELLQKALNGIYGGVAFLCADSNRAAAVKLIAEIDEIPEPIAAAELDGNIVKLSTNGEFRKEWMERAMDMARLIGMKDLAPVEQSYVSTFKPVPTA